MKVKIKPSILSGQIVIPPSKSYSHRAIISAALANGEKKSKINNLKFSVDIETTVKIMENWKSLKKMEKNLTFMIFS